MSESILPISVAWQQGFLASHFFNLKNDCETYKQIHACFMPVFLTPKVLHKHRGDEVDI